MESGINIRLKNNQIKIKLNKAIINIVLVIDLIIFISYLISFSRKYKISLWNFFKRKVSYSLVDGEPPKLFSNIISSKKSEGKIKQTTRWQGPKPMTMICSSQYFLEPTHLWLIPHVSNQPSMRFMGGNETM